MKKLLIAAVLAAFVSTSFKDGNDSFEVLGTTKGFKDSAKIYIENPETGYIDSAYILNNKFKFTGHVDAPTPFVIRTSFFDGMPEFNMLWIENSKITIEAEKGSLKSAQVKGSKVNEQNSVYRKLMQKIGLSQDSLYMALSMAEQESDSLAFPKLIQKQHSLMKQQSDLSCQFIKDHPDYLLSVYHLSSLVRSLSKEESKKLYDCLSADNQKTKYGQQVFQYLKLSKTFKVGDTAENFSSTDLNGKQVSLSDFKGKYVLLEFWGSGCGPCRMENPNLRNTYKTFKEKKFEILGVTVDQNKKDWERAVKDDSMNWTTVSDLKGINGTAATIYSIQAIPTNFLINPEGVIIAMNLRGDNLAKKLGEILNK